MITYVCTSCGRLDLLQECITSFLENSPKLERYIVIENGENSYSDIINCFPEGYNLLIIVNETNIGQVASIDKAYSLVRTPYIYHEEGDWKYYQPGFIKKSQKLLEWDNNILSVNVRRKFDGTKGSMHPVYGPFNYKQPMDLDYFKYYKYQYNYLGPYHGFSWNPGLRRKKEYDLIGNFKQYANEEGMNQFYIKHEYIAACLDTEHCYHIGENRETELRNE